MKILVIGNGGREHALAWRLAQGAKVQKVYVAPGNAGTTLEEGVENVAITAIPELIDFVKRENIELTVVGPEAPLAAGVVDADGIRRLEPYRKNYALIRYTSHINESPSSPTPNHTVTTPYPYMKYETKFQFSAKSEVGNYRDLEFIGFTNFRLWAAFTQQAYWQAFNVSNSSPFRESNYEPELIGTLGTGNTEGWKLLNVGFSHQSNGRKEPDSRSWNRLYLQGGWEWEDVHMLGRTWWRIPEKAYKNDNPDFLDHYGRAELIVHWLPERDDEIILLLRSNLNVHGHKGFMQLDWASPFKIGHSSQLNFQLTTGYGDSLIDYNHWQTTLGIGVVFKEW